MGNVGRVNLSIYQIDRVQFLRSLDKLIFFEFYKVDNVEDFFISFREEENTLKNDLFNPLFASKLSLIRELSQRYDVCKILIVYDNNLEKIFYKGNINTINNKFKEYDFIDFNEFSEIFIDQNNIDGGVSKLLGSAKETNTDIFVLNILESIGCLFDPNDDNGLEVTKIMLGNNATRGFDIDLFQFITTTGETIIFEFLKRENEYVTNYTAHPMRYCWTGGKRDNKQKFIGLWTVAQKLNGRLFCVNYSDNLQEGIGLLEIRDLDVVEGIRQEYKYNITYDEFIEWLRELKDYDSTDNDYLRKFNDRRKYFDNSFFSDWKNNRSRYC